MDFGKDHKISMEFLLWFEPERNAMLEILSKKHDLTILELQLSSLKGDGFQNDHIYSSMASILSDGSPIDKKQLSAGISNTKHRILLDANDRKWSSPSTLHNNNKRFWLQFSVGDLFDLHSLFIFCGKVKLTFSLFFSLLILHGRNA